MRVHITGVAGVLGSSLANHLHDKGYTVSGNDIVRPLEAWRLERSIKYIWKATEDLDYDDLYGVDIIIDCSLAVPDRPFGYLSPTHTLLGNLLPPLRLLEMFKGKETRPVFIYPSSFNVHYGLVNTTYREDTPLSPSSLYGWTKASAEMLYKTYEKMYDYKVIITRVGSAYGPKGRTDELVQKLIVKFMKSATVVLRSPHAKRLWTFSYDVLEFYDKLFEKIEESVGKTLVVAGNKGDRIVTNSELASMIKELMHSDTIIIPGPYEPGEVVDGKPVSFLIDASYTRQFLNWQPKYTLEEGLKITIDWFKTWWSNGHQNSQR